MYGGVEVMVWRKEGSDCGVVDGVEYSHSYLRLESLACIYGKQLTVWADAGILNCQPCV